MNILFITGGIIGVILMGLLYYALIKISKEADERVEKMHRPG